MVRRVPLTGAEKESLRASLDRHRDAVLWKLDGVGEADLRRSLTPSGTNLLGLVKHLAAVEYEWFCSTFGRETEPLPFDDDDPEADLRVKPDESTADIIAFYQRARSAADVVIADLALEDTGTAWWAAVDVPHHGRIAVERDQRVHFMRRHPVSTEATR